jgi:LuxR family maltose regulon positive regulatory protein
LPTEFHSRPSEADIEADLILTKLAIPGLRPSRVVRERLVHKLDQLPSRAVATVIAPAGYGKTTLMAEWAARSGGAVAWLTLSESDNDLVRFWQYVTATLQRPIPSVTNGTLRRMSLMRKPPFETPLHPIVSEISTWPGQVSLFLDDSHVILDPVVIASLSTFLSLAPGNLRVFIGGRSNPSGVLARVRQSNPIEEVRTRALSFTRKESAEFLDKGFSEPLPAQAKEAILKRSDGWVAGLQIASFGLREADDQMGFASSFSGQHRHLLDFFREEVLTGIRPGLRDFIIRTSILDRFNSDLCDAVLETQDSAKTLEELGRSDMFVLPLDDSGAWFRYQSLFRDVALQFLDAAFPGEERLLHQRASSWCERNGFIEESAAYAVKAEDWEHVVSLIAPTARDLIKSNKLGSLQTWILQLPHTALADAPYLCVQLARAQLSGSLHADIEPYLGLAERSAIERDDPTIMGAVSGIRAHRLVYRGATADAIELAESSLAILPEDEQLYRGIAHRIIGVSELLSDRPIRAQERFSESIELSKACGNTFTVCASMALQAFALGRRGLVSQALEMIELADRLCAEDLELPVVHLPLVHSRLLYEAWEIEPAFAILEHFDDLCIETGYRIFSANGHFMMAQLNWAKGDPDAVERHLELARTKTVSFGSIHEAFSPDTLVARMRLADGNWDSVEVWERSERNESNGRPNYDRLSLLERIRIWKAVNSRDRRCAEHHLENLRQLGQAARQAGRGADVADSWVAQATAQFHLGDVDLALSSLSAAISLAEPGGLLRPFFEEGPRIRPLLEEAANRRINPEFLARISIPATVRAIATAVVSLSERETEILRLLSLGYQNHEIANIVVLSENTIKTHLRNVYAKLGTKNRTQAVARARELKLVK